MTVSTNDNKITVSTTAEPESISTLIVVKSGEDVKNNSSVFAIKQSYANKDGDVVFSFNMPEKKNEELIDGEYDIYTKQHGKEKQIGTFCYASLESRNILNTEIENADESKFFEIINNEKNLIVLKALNFNMQEYCDLSEDEKNNVISMAYLYITDNEDVDFSKAFNLSLITNKIKSSQDIAELLEDADLAFDEIAFSEIEDEQTKEFITAYISSAKINSVQDFEDAYKKASILNLINNTRYDKMEDVLLKYENTLGISLTSYKNISNKTSVNEKIVTVLKSSPATTVEELEDIIADAQKTGNSSSSGGGSGSPSKGNSAQGGISSAIVTNKDPENIPRKEKNYFNDLHESEWARDAINKMAETGIVSGDGDGGFRPNDVMTREEFVKMLVMAAEVYDANAECEFEDVSNEAWYYKYVASAFKRGIIYGVTENTFGIGSKLTRQDMATIVLRAAQQCKEINFTREEKNFADENLISEYAKESVKKLYMAEVINGMDENNFAPLKTATRAQGALVIYKIFF